jgi:ABC-type lipoprotein release transport system permease subunit
MIIGIIGAVLGLFVGYFVRPWLEDINRKYKTKRQREKERQQAEK